MSVPSPIHYLRQRRALHQASKPTAAAKITSRPYLNPQTRSPLFHLPAELRNQIYEHALLASPDLARPYTRHSYYHRPGYTHARAIATNLLLSCRRIFLETSLLPLQMNEHVVWGTERNRWPPNVTRHSYVLDNNRLRASQRAAIRYVHLFVQQFWLEDWKGRQWESFTQSWPLGCPPRIRVTIRHSDWWYDLLGQRWPLALDARKKGRARAMAWVEGEGFERGSWGSRFGNLRGLEVFELELETLVGKKGELDAVVKKAAEWRFGLGDGNVLVLDEEATEKSGWVGSKHFKGLHASKVEAGLQLQQGRRATFSSLRSSRSQEEDAGEAEVLGEDDMLEYYVVLLTWRAEAAPKQGQEGAKAVEHTSSDKREGGLVSGGAANDATTNGTITNIVTPPRPLGLSYNRLNAVPTYYG